jgi:organic radical activating enzyme
MQNLQKSEKVIARSNSGDILSVHSIFKTIQGEGPFCGQAAVFIRLAGCNLQCPKCDTEYTNNRYDRTPDQITEQALVFAETLNCRIQLVVITGGEPFRQNLGPLILELQQVFDTVQVETNGTLPPPEGISWATNPRHLGNFIVVSPKTGSVHKKIQQNACAFKYVVSSSEQTREGIPQTALGHSAKPALFFNSKMHLPVYIQPADEKDPELNAKNLQAAVELCYSHGMILQLQIHKIIGVE